MCTMVYRNYVYRFIKTKYVYCYLTSIHRRIDPYDHLYFYIFLILYNNEAVFCRLAFLELLK